MIRVAVIGVGSMGQNHARVFADNEEVELVAVADPNEEQVLKIAGKHHAKAYTDYKEMLDKEEIDAVSIVAPTSLHKEISIQVIKRKKHVLLEKPIATNEKEANEIIICAEENQVNLMIGHIERFNPAVIKLKELLENGDLGEIYKIDIERVGPFPSRITDVGVIVDLSVHDLDIISYLIDATPSRIYAEKQQKLHPTHEDSVTALLNYKNSILAILNINYLSPTKTRTLKVFGKKGMFKVNYLNQELYFYENKSFILDNWDSVSEGDMRQIHILKKEPLKSEIESFISHLKNKTKPSVNGYHGLEALRIANLVVESANNKKIIDLK